MSTTNSDAMSPMSVFEDLFRRLIGSIYKFAGIDITYCIGGVNVTLPPYHLLPSYQRQFYNYDRFLPHLVSYIELGGLIIDVGANCGDTVASLVSANPNLIYLCIDGDETFYSYLQKNASEILKTHPGTRIETRKRLIGTTEMSGHLEGSGGTKRVITDSRTTNHASSFSALSDLFSDSVDRVDIDFQRHPLRLVKSDVDGFDYDVIRSAAPLLKSASPLLYFECDYRSDEQKAKYIELINWLFDEGYRKYWIFDNFGNFMLMTDNLTSVYQLFDYTWHQRHGGSRTVFYFDLLAAKQDSDVILANSVIDTYVNHRAHAGFR